MDTAQRTRRQLAGVLISGAVLATLGAPAASAGAADGPQAQERHQSGQPTERHQSAVPMERHQSALPKERHQSGVQQEQTERGTAGFWTAERMRQAAPLSLSDLGKDAVNTARKAVPGGKQLDIPPLDGGRQTKNFPQKGGKWTDGGKVTKTTGRVFFTYQGRTASCSGDAVNSRNGSTVMTAGHCVRMDGKWHKNWVFVPGYHDGKAPYGKWSATKTLSTPQWKKSEDLNYDVGAAVVGKQGGKRLTDAVGGQGLSFNAARKADMYAFGYPAEKPYDGSKLSYCSGRTFKDFVGTNDHGMSCNMTGGSSGGPWFTKFDEKAGTGLQSSVNSFGYQFLPDTMFGPYFGKDAKNLYQQAQAG